MIIHVYINLLPKGGFDMKAMYFHPSGLVAEPSSAGENILAHDCDIIFSLDTNREGSEGVHYYNVLKNRANVIETLILERFTMFMSLLAKEQY